MSFCCRHGTWFPFSPQWAFDMLKQSGLVFAGILFGQQKLIQDPSCKLPENLPQKDWIAIEGVLQNFLGGGFKCFVCSPQTLGKWSNLTNIFFKWVGSTTNQFCTPQHSLRLDLSWTPGSWWCPNLLHPFSWTVHRFRFIWSFPRYVT